MTLQNSAQKILFAKKLETKSGIELPDVEASVDVLAVVDVVAVVLPLLLPSLEVDVLAVVDVVAVVLPLLPSLEQTAMALNLPRHQKVDNYSVLSHVLPKPARGFQAAPATQNHRKDLMKIKALSLKLSSRLPWEPTQPSFLGVIQIYITHIC